MKSFNELSFVFLSIIFIILLLGAYTFSESLIIPIESNSQLALTLSSKERQLQNQTALDSFCLENNCTPYEKRQFAQTVIFYNYSSKGLNITDEFKKGLEKIRNFKVETNTLDPKKELFSLLQGMLLMYCNKMDDPCGTSTEELYTKLNKKLYSSLETNLNDGPAKGEYYHADAEQIIADLRTKMNALPKEDTLLASKAYVSFIESNFYYYVYDRKYTEIIKSKDQSLANIKTALSKVKGAINTYGDINFGAKYQGMCQNLVLTANRPISNVFTLLGISSKDIECQDNPGAISVKLKDGKYYCIDEMLDWTHNSSDALPYTIMKRHVKSGEKCTWQVTRVFPKVRTMVEDIPGTDMSFSIQYPGELDITGARDAGKEDGTYMDHYELSTGDVQTDDNGYNLPNTKISFIDPKNCLLEKANCGLGATVGTKKTKSSLTFNILKSPSKGIEKYFVAKNGVYVIIENSSLYGAKNNADIATFKFIDYKSVSSVKADLLKTNEIGPVYSDKTFVKKTLSSLTFQSSIYEDMKYAFTTNTNASYPVVGCATEHSIFADPVFVKTLSKLDSKTTSCALSGTNGGKATGWAISAKVNDGTTWCIDSAGTFLDGKSSLTGLCK